MLATDESGSIASPLPYDVPLAAWHSWSTPSALLVLGMRRSGASCASRILSLMGAELGSIRRAPSESVSWWPASSADQAAPRTDAARCRSAVWELSGSPIALIGNPGVSFTRFDWRDAVRDHSVVACLRHPLSVARSLERHDGLPTAEGLSLWHTYNLQLLERATSGRRVYWFDFDNGAKGARRLIEQLACDFPLEITEAALSHVQPALPGHQEKGRIPESVADLYDVLRARARAEQ